MLTHLSMDVAVGDQLVEFRCARCGLAAMASVTATSSGLRMSGVSLSSAQLDARVAAAQAVKLVPCPRCGRRDLGAQTRVAATGAVIGGLAAFIAWLVVAERLRASPQGPALALATAAATLLAVVGAVVALKLRSLRGRVRFQRGVG